MESSRGHLVDQIRDSIAPLNTEEAILAETVQLIHDFSGDFNWTGFYMLKGGALEVGPYLGPPTEHVRIELNQGICGAAASRKETVTVDDACSDPRFIACSISTRSEIVVPLMHGEVCLGEIDIDSDSAGNFSAEDKEMLEEIAVLVVGQLIAIRPK